jgi:hypothetical protein
MSMSDQVLTFENVVEQFLNEFPEFKEKAEEERDQWYPDPDEEPLQYVFFGTVVNEFLVEALKRKDNLLLLNRIFKFFEIMALSPDKKVPDLLTTETLEYLGDDKKVLIRARKLMGNKTLELSHSIEKFWGRE